MTTNAFTNYLENKIMAYVFTGTAFSSPSGSLYLGLFTAAPGESGGGTEVSGNGYARKAVTMTTSGNASTNSGAVEFDAATASWGTITYVAVFDALTSGNMLAYGELTVSKTIGSGDVFRIPAGDLDITLE
jgi:hypothetical protein